MPKLTTKQALDYIAGLPFEHRAFTMQYTKGGQIRLLDAHGKILFGTGGYGYSKSGVVLAQFLEVAMPELILNAAKMRGANYGSLCKNTRGLYGLVIYRPLNPAKPKKGSKQVTKWQTGDKAALQGMCGMGSIEGVLNTAGLALVEVARGKDFTTYRIEPLTKWNPDARLRGEAIRARLGYKKG